MADRLGPGGVPLHVSRQVEGNIGSATGLPALPSGDVSSQGSSTGPSAVSAAATEPIPFCHPPRRRWS